MVLLKDRNLSFSYFTWEKMNISFVVVCMGGWVYCVRYDRKI